VVRGWCMKRVGVACPATLFSPHASARTWLHACVLIFRDDSTLPARPTQKLCRLLLTCMAAAPGARGMRDPAFSIFCVFLLLFQSCNNRTTRSHSTLASMERRRQSALAAPAPAAYLERRRAEALALQRAAREHATTRARAALAASCSGGDAGGAGSGGVPGPAPASHHQQQQRSQHRGSGAAAATAAYASALTTPEWMTDVPAGLASEW
jgi:hypothetical protein